ATVAAAKVEYRRYAFINPELRASPIEVLIGRASSTTTWQRILCDAGKLLLSVSVALWLEVRRHIPHRDRQHQLASQPAFAGGKVRILVDPRDYRVGGHRSAGSRRPRLRIRNEGIGAWRHGVCDDPPVLPTTPERPRFGVDVRQSPPFHGLLCPVRGFLDIR